MQVPHNKYLHEYRDEYKANIYSTGRVCGSYYPYPTYHVDIIIFTLTSLTIHKAIMKLNWKNIINWIALMTTLSFLPSW